MTIESLKVPGTLYLYGKWSVAGAFDNIQIFVIYEHVFYIFRQDRQLSPHSIVHIFKAFPGPKFHNMSI